jgi:recombination protein RecA
VKTYGAMQAMRKLGGAMSKSKCIGLFINQLREKVGVMFGNRQQVVA